MRATLQTNIRVTVMVDLTPSVYITIEKMGPKSMVIGKFRPIFVHKTSIA